ncbi:MULTISPECIES: isoprenylcysteine carboxylmethyltransferase family protein [unclassified Haloferax]|uniref:methyltransferase family protein n=1 Tax=unclassified Haloferax TaxID=2625095 RepID=UPI002876084A|nr:MULTISPECIES: isoprenylcysteine carboxylmethyltransferase family protein [unclassified Haloferax]MDS0241348.1 isoprenylcysteine carboxylmethyltransferase family protein [Haloferax sp. S2CR25]MDS0444469.1 isoprenylcysteine carboxylmethyltransferase family protein [Haloferax sp. S2CR25-2]
MTEQPGSGHEPEHGRAEPGEILAPSPMLALIAFVVGIGLDRIAHIGTVIQPRNLPIGVLLVIVGVALFVGAILAMRRIETTPAHDDESPELLTEGVFRYSRNPIYLGQSLAYVGASLLLDTLWPLVTLVPLLWYLDRVIEREEAYLEATFGNEFHQYRDSVRRWL